LGYNKLENLQLMGYILTQIYSIVGEPPGSWDTSTERDKVGELPSYGIHSHTKIQCENLQLLGYNKLENLQLMGYTHTEI
jgi:hypothetical protein